MKLFIKISIIVFLAVAFSSCVKYAPLEKIEQSNYENKVLLNDEDIEGKESSITDPENEDEVEDSNPAITDPENEDDIE